MNTKKRIIIVRLFKVGFISLILNLIWEFTHHILYVDLSGISKYPHLIIASFVDMIIVLGIFTIVSLKNRNLNWMNNPRKLDYLLIVLPGLIIAMIIEIVNLNLGRWAYTSVMPTIFGIGISPFIQLAVTGIITLEVMKYSKLQK